MDAMDFDNPPADPIAPLGQWFEEARRTSLLNPMAMTVATVDPDGRPSARTVLLKGLDERGAVFYTSRISRKGRALEANPVAALLFYWDRLRRQACVEGRVTAVDDAESDTYFATRLRGAQVGAHASRQSEPIESRAALVARVAEIEAQYAGREVPRPPDWGGYRVSLDRIELWQGRIDRLHDRVLYVRAEDGGWRVERLSP